MDFWVLGERFHGMCYKALVCEKGLCEGSCLWLQVSTGGVEGLGLALEIFLDSPS